MVQQRINTGHYRPTKQAPRRVPLAKQKEVEKMMDDMRKQVIEHTNSSWLCLPSWSSEKDGSTRFCVDCRNVHDITKKDSPLSRIDDTLDCLSGAEWFSTLDLEVDIGQSRCTLKI